MWPFKSKPKKKFVRFIKEVNLDENLDYKTFYKIEVVTKNFYGFGVDKEERPFNSTFYGANAEEKALKFFERVVELNGNTETREVLKEVEI